MVDILGGLIGAGSSILGGILNNNSQQAAANQTNQWNFLMQLQNQAFQNTMSSTAYQRGVADMKAAGLNPAMMFGGGGGGPASSPSGSMSSGVTPQIRDVFGPAADAALRAYGIQSEVELRAADVDTRKKQVDLLQEQTNKTRDEAANVRAETALKLLDVAPRKLGGELVKSQIGQNLSSARQAESASAELSARQGKYASEIERTRAEAQNTRARTSYYEKFGEGRTYSFGDIAQTGIASAHAFSDTLNRLRNMNNKYNVPGFSKYPAPWQ